MNSEIIFRRAQIKDVDFCVETILQAESSGSDKQPWSIFLNLPEDKIRGILREILLEDVPGQELSLSIFTIAESEGQYLGSCGNWIEECEDKPSSILKAEIMDYFFPRESLEHARPLNERIKAFTYPKERHCAFFEYLYILPQFRSINLLLQLMEKSSQNAIDSYPGIHVPRIYGGTSGTNPFMIRATRRIGYTLWKTITLEDESLKEYIPSLTRYVMKKELYDNK